MIGSKILTVVRQFLPKTAVLKEINSRMLWTNSHDVATGLPKFDGLLRHFSPAFSGTQQVRTNIHKCFTRPSERKRVSKHGYKTRMSTPGGRAVIMRRILKGRHVLAH